MKSFAARFILLYSAILAIFIVISAALSIDGIEQVLFLLAFLPVAIYLVVTTIKEIKKILNKQGPSSDVSLSGKKVEFFAGIIIFVALLIIGVKNLSSQSSAQNNVSETPKGTVESDETSGIVFENTEEEKKTLTVKITDGSPAVNLRAGPGTFHDILGKAEDGQIYTYTKINQGWYKIDFEGQEAWIFENYVELEEVEEDKDE